jgi:hypothetical protein
VDATEGAVERRLPDWQSIIVEHEGRLGALEKGQRDLEQRVNEMDRKLDQLLRFHGSLGWKLLAIFLSPFAAIFVAWAARVVNP